MAVASDYGVFFGFKGQDGTYYGPNGSVGLYHLGNDYGTPTGTQLTLGSSLLGLTGATGIVSGPHVHIAKWKPGNVAGGYYVAKYNRSYFDPSDVWRTTGTIIERGKDAAAGNFVRWAADNGYTYEAFHLSQINVNVGDKVGQQMSMTDLGQARIMAFHVAGRNGYDGRPNALNGESDADLKASHVGKDTAQELWGWYNSPEGQNFRNTILPAVYAERDALRVSLKQTQTDLNGLIKKYDDYKKTTDAQIVELNKQLAAATGTGNIDQATKDMVAETNGIVKKIWEFLQSIFKSK